MATGQRKRDKKVSKGTARGARKTGPLDPITLILLGKGRMDSRYPLGKPVEVKREKSKVNGGFYFTPEATKELEALKESLQHL